MLLLHIGDTLVQRTFDPWVAVFAFLAFALATAVIWAPVHGRRRLAHRLLGYAAALAVALAVLPLVLPYDHLVFQEPASESDSVHAAHCHGAPGSCSDAPVSSGAGQFLTAEPLLQQPALSMLLMLVIVPTLVGIGIRPALRPPYALTPA